MTGHGAMHGLAVAAVCLAALYALTGFAVWLYVIWWDIAKCKGYNVRHFGFAGCLVVLACLEFAWPVAVWWWSRAEHVR